MEFKESTEKTRHILNTYYNYCMNNYDGYAKDQAIDEVENILLMDNLSDPEERIVIELSDNELKIVTKKELEEIKDECMKFDGFYGFTIKGILK